MSIQKGKRPVLQEKRNPDPLSNSSGIVNAMRLGLSIGKGKTWPSEAESDGGLLGVPTACVFQSISPWD